MHPELSLDEAHQLINVKAGGLRVAVVAVPFTNKLQAAATHLAPAQE